MGEKYLSYIIAVTSIGGEQYLEKDTDDHPLVTDNL